MKVTSPTAAAFLITLCLSIGVLPSSGRAQDKGAQAAAGRAGVGGPAGLTKQIHEVLKQLDLTPDEETSIDGIIKQAQSDVRESMQGMRDATPEERRQKMKDMQKIMFDTRDKIAQQLTPDQKAKYYPLVANLAVTRASDNLAMIKSAADKMELTGEVRDQLKPIFSDTGKTLEGYKSDADAVKDSQTADDLQQKIGKTMMENNRQIATILGQDDAKQLMQNVRQAGQNGRGESGPNHKGDLKAEDTATTAPTTAPAAQ